MSRHAALALLPLLALAGSCMRPAADVPNVEKPRSPAAAAQRAPAQPAREVRITRDSWGIPHVYGKTDADAVFGLLYAQCEDDFNRVETNFIRALGRLAEVEGEAALYQDLRMRLFIDHETVKKEYAASAQALKALMQAWADGINHYLARHPEVKPRLLQRFEPWMALTFSEGSIGGDIESISEDDLRAFYAEARASGALAGAPVPPRVKDARELDAEWRGSNGIAIAPARSVSGSALLLINPHTSFYFRPEVHVRSDAGLNAYGAVTWGQFFVYQGFNESSGWMHTSSRADVIDYYAETIVEQGGRYWYRYGAELRPLTVKEVSIPVKQGDALVTKSFSLYATHHGPIVAARDGKWLSVRLMQEHEKALTQSFLRTKARNYAEFRHVLELRTNSSNNTVFADTSGNIAYFHGNFMPRRDARFDWTGVVDGADPATDWQGLHELDELVSLHNPGSGWLQNCNSTPFSAAGAWSPQPQAYPSYMAPDLENARGLHAVRLLTASDKFSLETLIAAAYDNYLTGFDSALPALFAAYARLPKTAAQRAELEQPIELLRGWDRRSSLDSVATTLAVYWGRNLTELTRSLKIQLAQATATQRLTELSRALRTLNDDFGTWKMPWGEVNRLQRVSGAILQPFDDQKSSLPIALAPGQWGALASFDARTYPGTKKLYGSNGNSFVAAVEFGKRLRAKSLLVGGQSGDPKSPHFFDQAELYAAGRFKDVFFYPEDIEQHAERSYQPLTD